MRFDERSQRLHLLAGFALDGTDRPVLALGQGLGGQCAQERRSMVLSNPPPDYLQITSSLGESAAHALLLHPIVRNDRLLGVVELASFSEFSDRSQEFMQSALPILAMSMEIVERSESTQMLLAQSQAQANELEAQRAEIAETEAWYRGILESAPDGMLVANVDGRIIMANAQLESMFGYASGALVGMTVEALVPLAMRERHPSLRQGFMQTGGTRSMAVRDGGQLLGLRRDGSEFPIDVGLSRLPALGSREACVCASVRDTTKRHEADKALAESAQRLDFALRGGNLGLWDWDVATGHSRINDIWAEMLGYRHDELVDDKGSAASAWEDLLHPEDSESAHRAFSNCIEDPRSQEYEALFRLRHKSGDWRWILSLGRAIERDTTGRAVRLVGIHQDITERMQLQEQMAHAKESAEAATQAKSEFLANMSHEIRTPMNAIIGMSYLALQTSLDKRQRNYIEKVHRAAENLLGIINDILDFSKIEAGKLSLERIDFRLEDVMDNLANLVGMKAEDKGLELLFKTEPDMPTALVGDPLRLGQVLINLGNNAVKFTDQGDIVVGVEMTSREGNEIELHFWVRDTGIGMDESQCERLFQSFSQADASTTRKYGGTGLGLAISKSLVEAMGGQIWVKSQPGHGSTFHFLARFGVQSNPAPRRSIQHAALGGKRVLVVDDNAMAREIMSGMAKAFGLEVDMAAGGHEALLKVAAQAKSGLAYDLVLMDWRMPMMDGIEAVQQLEAQLHQGMPAVIMVTAFGREEALSAAESRGIPLSTVLTKPVTPTSLVEALCDVFDGDPESPSTVNATTLSESGSAATKLRGTKVLLVEDNEMNQELATELLQQAGMEVVVADNGQLALDQMQRDARFDAILMDCQMPVMDGFQATKAIRENPAWKSIPVIAMTANVMASDRERVLAAGMNDHISKPLRIKEMFDTLAKWIKPANNSMPNAPPALKLEGTIPLPEITGLDLRAGLLTMNGDHALYRRMLLKFLRSQADFAVRFDASLADPAAAIRAAHTLKGLAGNIGASSLEEAARLLEKACESGRPREQIDTALSATLEALCPLLERLDAYAIDVEAVSREMPIIDPTIWMQELPQVRRLLAELDQEAVERLRQLLAMSAGSPAETVLRRATAAAENFDFDSALSALQAL